MFKRKNLEFSKFKYLADMMERMPPQEVPADFTVEVMAVVSATEPVKPSFLQAIYRQKLLIMVCRFWQPGRSVPFIFC